MTLRERDQAIQAQKQAVTVRGILERAAMRNPQYSFIGIFEVEGSLFDKKYHYRAAGSAQLLLDISERTTVIAELLVKETLLTEEKYSVITRGTSLYIYV